MMVDVNSMAIRSIFSYNVISFLGCNFWRCNECGSVYVGLRLDRGWRLWGSPCSRHA